MKFSVLSFSLLTTSLVCPSAQGAIVHKPSRGAATSTTESCPSFTVSFLA